MAKVYNNRIPTPVNHPMRNGQAEPASKLPVRICLIGAYVCLFALIALLLYTGSYVMCVHFWIYIMAVALIAIFLIGAGAFAICRRVKSERTRRISQIAAVAFLGLLVMTAGSFSYVINGMYQKPIGYFDSPEGGNRLVVMSTEGDNGKYISAYPALGNHFYVAALESEMVLSNGVVQRVEWENEQLARIVLCDIDGNDTSFTVDFSELNGETAGQE